MWFIYYIHLLIYYIIYKFKVWDKIVFPWNVKIFLWQSSEIIFAFISWIWKEKQKSINSLNKVINISNLSFFF